VDADRWDQRRRERWERRHERWRNPHGGPNAFGGMIFGLMIVAAGVLFLLRNIGIFYFEGIWDFWPVILIVIGISKLANPQKASSVISGLMIGGLGAVFLLKNLGYLDGDVWQYVWPGVVIAVGLSILVQNLESHDRARSQAPASPGQASSFPGAPAFTASTSSSTSTSAANYLHVECMFSGTRRKIETQDFEGGKVTVVFGGAEIDLRSAETKREEITIKAEAVFGGIELWVPAHWKVILRGSAVGGNFEDKTFPPAAGAPANAPRLIVTGAAVFGGVVVKN
jgi:cell wall-active antibiotic response 4TMS protein YvqF